MQLKLKLYAGLEKYLPAPGKDNTAVLDINDDLTVNMLLNRFNLPREQAHLVLLNGVYVRPDERDSENLINDGDTLAIWPPVAGG